MPEDNQPDSTVPMHHPSWMDECASFQICGVCDTLYGCVGGNSEQRQECDCTKSQVREGLRPSPATWPGFDFSEAATLCYGCGAEVLRSGSRWSVWFCDACKEQVRALHQRHRRYLIPIGRHSMMNGFGLTGSETQDQAAVTEFVLRAGSLVDRIAVLTSWAATIVAEHVRTHGFKEGRDVPLLEYLDALVRQPVNKADAFARLVKQFGASA